jgi:DNA polymerase III epsilon subunit-like protein
MKVLVFDTETTGLPEENNASILDTFRWPYIVQLSFIYYDSEINDVIDYYDNVIKLPDNITIPEDSIRIHGITNEIMREKGINIITALKKFNDILKDCDIVVAHNISFDKRMIMVECIRNKISQYFTRGQNKKPEFCTMKNSKNICKIKMVNFKGEEYFKSPKLSELYTFIFKEEPKNLHNSFVDILLCLRSYFMIRENKDIIVNKEIQYLFNIYNI